MIRSRSADSSIRTVRTFTCRINNIWRWHQLMNFARVAWVSSAVGKAVLYGLARTGCGRLGMTKDLPGREQKSIWQLQVAFAGLDLTFWSQIKRGFCMFHVLPFVKILAGPINPTLKKMTGNDSLCDVAHRLYQVVIYLNNTIRFYCSRVNVISYPLIRKARPSLLRFSRKSEILNGIIRICLVMNYIHIEK